MGHQFQQLMMGMACLCTSVWSPGWKESKSRVTGQVESGISWMCLHLYMVVVMFLQLDHSWLCWPQWLSRASPYGLGFLTTWLLPNSCTAYMMAQDPEPSVWANKEELCDLWGPSLSGHTDQFLLDFLGCQQSPRLDSESLILNGEDEPPPFDANMSAYFRMCLKVITVCVPSL